MKRTHITVAMLLGLAGTLLGSEGVNKSGVPIPP